ncbi:MAG TPA: adenylate/guanylate cyclase domain-containing protein [Chthoniobacterales bacterium]|nr:adenylate/guanylate cyclase domain-containing protein [Chthoniobacterales bacterium]
MPTLPTSSLPQTDLQLEIAHLLLIDIVGYSKLLVNEQIETVQELGRIVRNTECFRKAEAAGKLIRVPTGDGMALLFFQSPEEPVRCALEISQQLKENSEIRLRMGIHSGPVNQVKDVNDTINVAGTGINVAQRVMDCGDAGHILLSKHVAEDLAQYRHWQPYLHDLGECEVKHGLRLHIVNLYKDGVGNPALPEKLRRGKRWKQSVAIRPIGPLRVPKSPLIVALVLSVLALAISFAIFLRRATPASSNATVSASIPEKSIAVLPFENLSEDKQNAYFSDGVQDEILNGLSKVADLKVISRTSVMQYRTGTSRNLREIAKALGVAHVIEGSVQRVGDRVRVSAQLIDARTDMHIWGEHYDRDLADVFAIESELAEKIVTRLKATLSPQEKAAIEERPTNDLIAYELYQRARDLLDAITFKGGTPNLNEAVRLLDNAVSRDPKFALGYCHLARAHDLLYSLGIDHTANRLALAEKAVQTALGLRPDSGEPHLALARHLYLTSRDYERARKELLAARTVLPNESLVFILAGYIDRRQGRWEESTKELEKALELDPQNFSISQQAAYNYQYLRRFKTIAKILDRLAVINSKDVTNRLQRGLIDIMWKADARPLHATIQSIVSKDPNTELTISNQWMYLAVCERDKAAVDHILNIKDATDACRDDAIPFPLAWCEGVAARSNGNAVAARAAFTRARIEVEEILKKQPDYAEELCVLGMIDAALGKKEEAIREGQRAAELLPVNKDAMNSPKVSRYLAVIYAWAGEKKLALDELTKLTRMPSDVNYGDLRLNPYWDPLRGDPRFEKIVAFLAPDAARY